MSPKELLQQLNETGEQTAIEAKTGSAIGKSVLETISAFSNEPGLGGGWILLGVRCDEDAFAAPYTTIGLPDPEQLSVDIATQCANSFNHPIRVRIEPEQVNELSILAIHVPEAEASEKPIFIKREGLPRGAFRRIASADVRCTDDDLELFLQQRRGETFDAGIVPDATLNDFDEAAVEEYRRLRFNARPSAEELRFAKEDLLFALKCVSRDERSILRPTRAGLILFGSAAALRRWFPMMRVDYIRVPGVTWVEDADRRYETIEMRVPLIEAIRRARAAVLDDLPKAFSLPPGQLHRRDIPVVPDRVIREAVVNAVMHRSYRIHGAIQIIRYANRLEIRNPGHSLVSDERLGEHPNSRTRNPLIAAVLHDTDLAETKGSGIRVMRELMVEAGLAAPTFDSNREGDCFVVTLLFHHFLSPEDWQWLGHFQEFALNDDDARALVFVREKGVITNFLYRDVTRADVLTASQHLRKLRDFGLIEQHSKGSDTYYTPTTNLLLPWDRIMGQTSLHRHQSVTIETQSDMTTRQSDMPLTQSGMVETQSDKVIRKKTPIPDDLPPQLKQDLLTLKLKVAQPEMENLVFRLCEWRPFSADELAGLLSRNRRYIRERLVTPMLRSQRLVMTIPDQPRHPQQKYHTPSS